MYLVTKIFYQKGKKLSFFIVCRYNNNVQQFVKVFKVVDYEDKENDGE